MPLNEIPTFFHPELRNLIDVASDEAWLELRDEHPSDETLARRKLATTIVALAAIGETDSAKLKKFALHAARAAALHRNPARKAGEASENGTHSAAPHQATRSRSNPRSSLAEQISGRA